MNRKYTYQLPVTSEGEAEVGRKEDGASPLMVMFYFLDNKNKRQRNWNKYGIMLRYFQVKKLIK